MSAEQKILSFRFEGGTADDSQLDFYDASRFLYGASRFVYTLEQFRQKGRILSRITEKIEVDYRIGTPKEGSFLVDVFSVAAPVVSDLAYSVPIDVLIAWVKEKLLPGKDSAVRALKLVREIEEEKTRQSQEETKRLTAQASNLDSALKIIEKALDAQKSESEYLREQLAGSRNELLAARERSAVLESYFDALSQIDEKTEEQLISKSYSQLLEIGKPLRRSASSLEIGGPSFKKPLGFLSRQSLEAMEGLEEDTLPTTLVGDIVRFDKYTGWGKFQSEEFPKQISFLVPRVAKNKLKDEILDLMKTDDIEISFYFVRDKRGTVHHIILDKLLSKREGVFG